MAYQFSQTGEQIQQLLNDIPAKELSSNKTNQWSATPSATKYPTEALVADRFTEDEVAIDGRIKKFYTTNRNNSNTAYVNSVSDSDDGSMRDLKIYGMGSQQSYSGYQLADWNATQTVYDVTYTKQDTGGKYLLTGTPTGSSAWNPLSKTLSSGTYTISFVTNYTGSQSMTFNVVYNSAIQYRIQKNSSITFTIDAETTVNIWNDYGGSPYYDLTGAVFEFMIESGSTAHSYEPYVGGIPAPNPSYPQAIHSTVNPSMNVSSSDNTWYASLPTGYQQVEYIESSSTQYIDTGLTFNSQYSLEYDFQLSINQASVGLFGSISGNNTNRYEVFIKSNGRLEFGYANSFYDAISSDTERHTIKYEKNVILYDNSIIYSFEQNAFTCSNTFYLFNMHRPYALAGSSAKLYGIKIWNDNNILVREYIPCYRISDGVIGMYDKVNNIFYVNGGAGTFVKGVDVKGNTATLSKTLHAIPVSSGGNITIGGQQYISDYVDVERKKIVRMVGYWDTTSFRNWSFDTTHIWCHITDTISNISSNGCNTPNSIMRMDSFTIGTRVGEAKMDTGAWLNCNIVVSSQSELESYLQSHNMWLMFPLATPTEESLTDAEVADFLAMRSYYPQTNVSVTSDDLDGQATFLYPCSMQNFVEYVKGELGDSRETVYNMQDISDRAFINAQYAEILALLALED